MHQYKYEHTWLGAGLTWGGDGFLHDRTGQRSLCFEKKINHCLVPSPTAVHSNINNDSQ